MKKARYVSMAAAGFLALAVPAQADPQPRDPNLQYDADGVPYSVTRQQGVRLTPQEVAEVRKEQAHATADKDWLIRDYEKARSSDKSDKSDGDQSGNLYFELSANKDLAKLAGLPSIDDADADGKSGFRTGDTRSGRSANALRSNGSTSNHSGPLLDGNFMKPAVALFSMPGATSLNAYNTSLFGDAQQQQPRRAPVSTDDPTDIETPGMIAAEKNPNPDTLDLTLDVLPGESIDHARSHQDNDALLTLPLPMNADQLHRAQAAQINTSTANNTTQPAPADVKPAQVYHDEDPTPVTKTPVLAPVRAPIAGPFDILNR